MAASLTPDERAVVDEAVQEILDGPRPRDRGPLGCLLAFPGFLILLVAPVVVRRLDLGGAVGIGSLTLGIALLVIGLVMYFSAGSFVRNHYAAAAEAGFRGLEAWDAEADGREEALRGATLVVLNAMAAYGPTTTPTFDAEEGRRRLGSLLPLVEAVEEYLVEQGSVFRVFTEEPQLGGDVHGGGPRAT